MGFDLTPEGRARLEEENQFLKMKLMLEEGANFSSHGANEEGLPVELENQFLHYIIEFEKQARKCKMVKVKDRLGDVSRFRPVHSISDGEIEEAWVALRQALAEHRIGIEACSPRIKSRELYRFATEELFEMDIDDIAIEGLTTCFSYDEFYPDPLYECENLAVSLGLQRIFSKRSLQLMYGFGEGGIELNGTALSTEGEFIERVNRFKDLFDELRIEELTCHPFQPTETSATLSGTYHLKAMVSKENFSIAGAWEIGLKKECDWWTIKRILIKGIDFI